MLQLSVLRAARDEQAVPVAHAHTADNAAVGQRSVHHGNRVSQLTLKCTGNNNKNEYQFLLLLVFEAIYYLIREQNSHLGRFYDGKPVC